MEPNQQPPQKGAKVWRKLLIPVAFAWLFLLIATPLMLTDERYGLIAAISGFAFGVLFVIAAPKSFFDRQTPPAKVEPARKRQLPPNRRLVPTGIGLGLAAYVGYFLATNSIRDRSPLVLFAAILVIGLIRRPLRVAWGINGSIAGIAISGALIVLLVRSATTGLPSRTPMLIGLSAMVLGVELYSEWRTLQRNGFFDIPEAQP